MLKIRPNYINMWGINKKIGTGFRLRIDAEGEIIDKKSFY